jgi:hypothetical protein
MAVRANELKVLQPVVAAVTVDVVELERKGGGLAIRWSDRNRIGEV